MTATETEASAGWTTETDAYRYPVWRPFPQPEKAACRTVSDADESFFPEGYSTSAYEAKLMCMRCPIRDTCLDYALEMETGLNRSHRFGIYGGSSPSDRAKMDKGVEVELFRNCAHPDCGEMMPVFGEKRYCSEQCQRWHRRGMPGGNRHNYRVVHEACGLEMHRASLYKHEERCSATKEEVA